MSNTDITNRDQGIKAIIALQKVANITESPEHAAEGWDAMSDEEKSQTLAAYSVAFPEGEEGEACGCGHDHSHDHEAGSGSLPGQVRDIIMKVMYTNEEVDKLDREAGEEPEGMVKVGGIVRDFGFHPERLMNAAEEIRTILRQVVHPDFISKDGASFLNLCTAPDGTLWTGMHQTMEEILCLAMALRWARYLLPRILWQVLPGSMPYVTFSFEGPPVLNYPRVLKKEPTTLDAAGMKRFEVWDRISKLPGKSSSIILQELWDVMDIDPAVARRWSREERVWAITNAEIPVDQPKILDALVRMKEDPSQVFAD